MTSSSETAPAAESAQSNSTALVAHEGADSREISAERTYTRSSSFTRTVWLPQPVDASKVQAKLEDGVLTLRVPKAEEQGSVKANVE